MPGSTSAAQLLDTLACRTVALIAAGAFLLALPQRPLLAQQLVADAPLTPQSTLKSPQQLQQLVAPIALYPDALVAQILAASTYPAEVADAAYWQQQNSSLQGSQLADAVNGQTWDPSVQALTQFPTVLSNMGTNISWTSSLGDAYVNQPQDVMSAVQTLRYRAQQAGTLQSNAQENVSTQGSTIIIEPANPAVVYVPAYDPWTIYGAPLAIYPGWESLPGIFYAGRGFSWGLGIGIGAFAGYGWGWHNWGADWRSRNVMYNHARYVSHSPTFINRGAGIDRSPTVFSHDPMGGNRGFQGVDGGNRGFQGVDGGNRGVRGVDGGNRGFQGVEGVNRGVTGIDPRGFAPTGFTQPGFSRPAGFTQPFGAPGMRSSAFSGFGHGGMTSGFSGRGQASFGGGGFRGGGGRGGGGGRR